MRRIYTWEDVCIGCHLCELACVVAQSSSSNPVVAYRNESLLPAPRLRVVEEANGSFSFASTCHQCEEPLCLYSCLTGALYRDERGLVRVEAARCVGCWTCVLACPYGAIRPGAGATSVKCDLCQGRRETPACVEACPNGALALAEEPPVRWREVATLLDQQFRAEPVQEGAKSVA
ncbi:MAG TPA: 4Fe-4S dicluster domain-containing protein [Firmicutes bacterium]|nr:4Fe-4S dicluster domain-containing protein [Bacillota bacterium]